MEHSLKKNICELCAVLNVETPERKIYDDINHWWRELGQCKVKGLFKNDFTYGFSIITFIISFFTMLLFFMNSYFRYRKNFRNKPRD